MNPTANRRKGAAFEQAVAGYLARHGFPNAERRHLAGTNDRGDMAGVIDSDGDPFVIEVKNCKSWSLGVWWSEAEKEAVNAGVLHKILVIRRHGTTDAGKAWVVMSLEDWALEHGTHPAAVAAPLAGQRDFFGGEAA